MQGNGSAVVCSSAQWEGDGHQKKGKEWLESTWRWEGREALLLISKAAAPEALPSHHAGLSWLELWGCSFPLHSLTKWQENVSFPVLCGEEVRHGKAEDLREQQPAQPQLQIAHGLGSPFGAMGPLQRSWGLLQTSWQEQKCEQSLKSLGDGCHGWLTQMTTAFRR